MAPAHSTEYIPRPVDAIELPVDDLALRLLRLIDEQGQGHLLHRGDASLAGHWLDHTGGVSDERFLRAIGEAYDWLLFNGLIAAAPGARLSDRAYITQRGERALAESDPLNLLRAEAQIRGPLHPSIAHSVRSQYLLGRYEQAVFIALRQVEIRVRELGRFDDDLVGMDLMAQAFKPAGGKLADMTITAAEREATMALFRGAVGVFKNPASHREVDYDDAILAAEVVSLADLLLRMLDRVERTHMVPATQA
jgi:uncharacterized protein (TIGR02391 family)